MTFEDIKRIETLQLHYNYSAITNSVIAQNAIIRLNKMSQYFAIGNDIYTSESLKHLLISDVNRLILCIYVVCDKYEREYIVEFSRNILNVDLDYWAADYHVCEILKSYYDNLFETPSYLYVILNAVFAEDIDKRYAIEIYDDIIYGIYTLLNKSISKYLLIKTVSLYYLQLSSEKLFEKLRCNNVQLDEKYIINKPLNILSNDKDNIKIEQIYNTLNECFIKNEFHNEYEKYCNKNIGIDNISPIHFVNVKVGKNKHIEIPITSSYNNTNLLERDRVDLQRAKQIYLKIVENKDLINEATEYSICTINDKKYGLLFDTINKLLDIAKMNTNDKSYFVVCKHFLYNYCCQGVLETLEYIASKFDLLDD